MCEGKHDDALSAAVINSRNLPAVPADDNLTEDQVGMPTALADSYLGDYWGLGFSDRLSY